GVDLLTDDRSSNLYTIALNKVNFATINNLVKNNLVQGLPKMKFERDHLCSACEQGKIHQKHHKSKTAFPSNKPLYLLHMDLCGPMHVQSIIRKRYVLVVVDDYSREKSSNPSVSNVSEASKKDLEDLFQDFYNEYFDSSKIMKSSTTNVETSINEEVFHESISNNMIPNGDEASTLFHDSSNVHTYYQPYPHEKKWTKDHPLHIIIGDPKSSVQTRGQLANSYLFSCLLSSIEPANVAEALRDADWFSAMQEELDQFERLKVWRLVP
nr:ribonuclease H-like domain-containing protein [Tanacetum cinerariifolium]